MQVNMGINEATLELGSKGILLSVYDNDGNYRGKLRVGKAKIEWCKGRVPVGNGELKHWNEVIAFFES